MSNSINKDVHAPNNKDDPQMIVKRLEPETTWEKVKRKFTAEPFVPLGAIATVVFLSQGLKAFRSGEKHKAQMLMRGRVFAQGFTVMAMVIGAGVFQLKPHDHPKTYQEKMDRDTKEKEDKEN